MLHLQLVRVKKYLHLLFYIKFILDESGIRTSLHSSIIGYTLSYLSKPIKILEERQIKFQSIVYGYSFCKLYLKRLNDFLSSYRSQREPQNQIFFVLKNDHISRSVVISNFSNWLFYRSCSIVLTSQLALFNCPTKAKGRGGCH